MNFKIKLFSFCCIVFVLLDDNTHAQSPGADSLEATLLRHHNIADSLIEDNKLPEALKNCEESDRLLKQFPGIKNSLSTTLFSQHAKVLYKLNRYKEAELYLDKGLQPVNLSLAALRSGKWNSEVSVATEYIETVSEAGNYFIYMGLAQSHKQLLRTGIEILNKAVKANLNLRNFLFEAGINEGFEMENTNLFENLLSALFKARTILDENNVMANAFSTIESAKAGFLKNVAWEENKLFEALPDSVNAGRLKMKDEVYRALSIVRENNTTANESSFISKRGLYMEFLKKIKSDFGIKESATIAAVSAEDLRLTQFKGTIMNYFIGKKYLYIFIHSGYRKYFICKRIPDGFEKELLLVKDNYLSREGTSDAQSINELKRISREWYQLLLSYVDIKNELVIIPHRMLGFISFEMLDANEKGPGTEYIIEKHTVRYELSASLMLAQLHTKAEKPLKPFGGFAASDVTLPPGDSLLTNGNASIAGSANPALAQTADEVNSIGKVMGGDVYLHTKPVDFLNNAANYRVVHIAAQAFADEVPLHGYNFLFETDSPGTNTVRDVQIASMSLHSRLAVLSACNTGFGSLHTGEGMIGPGRPFFIAGCPAVVMSLWTVNDASAAKIMTSFYTYLKKGETKSDALRHAKLDYLKNETDPAKKHPYYWAGFIVAGNNTPLPAADFLKQHWGIIVIAIAAIFLVLLYFRIRSNKAAA